LHESRHAAVTAVLDEVMRQSRGAQALLDSLAASHPRHTLVDRAAAAHALLRGDHATALRLFTSLAARTPDDTTVQLGLGEALERAGQAAQARLAYVRAIELQPDDEVAFRALLRLEQGNGSLDDLLARVRRLQVRRSGSLVLIEREIELLHRMGRLDEAAAAARRLQERKGTGEHAADRRN
jgi:predicted Zn-dependent protease